MQPIWLVLTTKHHIINHPKLKPTKIALPHSLHSTPSLSICLITPSPQRAFKDVVAQFPPGLSKKITRTIDVVKLKAKYKTAEAQRLLRDTHDVFLADDRIITFLPKILGKSLYSSTSKRPIPIRLEATKHKTERNAALPSTKKKKEKSDVKSCVPAESAAKEIEKALATTQIYLNPSVTTSIRVGTSTMSAKEVEENLRAVVEGLTTEGKIVQWRNVKAMHIKGPETAALPIWLASELWVDEGEVVEKVEGKRKRVEGDGKRVKALEGAEAENAPRKRVKGVDTEEKERRTRLKEQKERIQKALESSL